MVGLCLFRRCTRRIWRSCIGKVTEGRPLRGRSLVVPVSCRRCLRRVIVVWDTFKRLAISVGLKPLWSIPTALSLSTLVRRGMTSAIWFCDKLSLWVPATNDYKCLLVCVHRPQAQAKLSPNRSISLELRNSCLASLIRRRATVIDNRRHLHHYLWRGDFFMQTRLTYLSFMVNKKMCVSFFVQYISA